MKMRYSIERKDIIYVKRYGILSFAKNMGKSLSKAKKSLMVLKKLQQIQQILPQKEQFKKLQRQLEI